MCGQLAPTGFDYWPSRRIFFNGILAPEVSMQRVLKVRFRTSSIWCVRIPSGCRFSCFASATRIHDTRGKRCTEMSGEDLRSLQQSLMNIRIVHFVSHGIPTGNSRSFFKKHVRTGYASESCGSFAGRAMRTCFSELFPSGSVYWRAMGISCVPRGSVWFSCVPGGSVYRRPMRIQIVFFEWRPSCQGTNWLSGLGVARRSQDRRRR